MSNIDLDNLKNKSKFFFIAVALLGVSSCTPDQVQSFQNQVNQATTSLSNASSGPPQLSATQGLASVGLINILPPLDPAAPIRTQWPHVAIAVMSSPPGWFENWDQMAGVAPWSGCWKLKATIWSNATHSRETPEFYWCVPSDVNGLPQGSYLDSLQTPADVIADNQAAGRTEINGPRPPDHMLPVGRDIDNFEMTSTASDTGGGGIMRDLNVDSTSRFMVMFASVRMALGEDFSVPDSRVWISSITDIVK